MVLELLISQSDAKTGLAGIDETIVDIPYPRHMHSIYPALCAHIPSTLYQHIPNVFYFANTSKNQPLLFGAFTRHSTSSNNTASTSQITVTTVLESIANRHSHARNQSDTERCRTPFVVIANGFALLDAVDAPYVDGHGVEEGEFGNDGESGGRRDGYCVAEVEQRGCDGAEDDGEFELERGDELE